MKDALRFSIKHLLLWTAVVALFCLALKNASAAWASAMLGLALVALAAGVLLSIFRRGAVQAYWIGFALCGWLYVAVLMYGGTFGRDEPYHPFRPDALATTQLSIWTYQKVFAWIAWPADQSDSGFFPGGMGMGGMGDPAMGGFTYPGLTAVGNRGPYQHDFVNVAHALWTLLLGTCGGVFARWLYLTGPDKNERGGASMPG